MRLANSSLPSLLIPCPSCLKRMSFRCAEPLAEDLELQDIVYECAGCGTELVRTLHGSTFDHAA